MKKAQAGKETGESLEKQPDVPAIVSNGSSNDVEREGQDEAPKGGFMVLLVWLPCHKDACATDIVAASLCL